MSEPDDTTNIREWMAERGISDERCWDVEDYLNAIHGAGYNAGHADALIEAAEIMRLMAPPVGVAEAMYHALIKKHAEKE